jgi:hypothetical protein
MPEGVDRLLLLLVLILLLLMLPLLLPALGLKQLALRHGAIKGLRCA